MVGQKKLFSIIDRYTLQTIPKTLLFIGEEGCGKRTIVNYLADKLNLKLVTISKDVADEELIEYQQSVINTMYLIDLREFQDKQQNKLLKFIEEPSSTVFISLIANSELLLLPTILNRCTKLRFEVYTKEELKQVQWLERSSNEQMFEICKTPGQLLETTEESINSLIKFCDVVIDNISGATYANTLGISTRINYKEEYDKFNFDLFFNTLEYLSFNKYRDKNDNVALTIYKYVNEYKKKLNYLKVQKENFILNFLTNLWDGVQECAYQH